MKIIGRISKSGKEYWQTAIKVEGQEQSEFIPVFLKKGLEKLNFTSKETKKDKNNVVYYLYDVDDTNVFLPPVDEKNPIKRAIITK